MSLTKSELPTDWQGTEDEDAELERSDNQIC